MLKKYINDIKSMSTFKKVLLGLILVVAIVTGFTWKPFVKTDSDGQPIYGIKTEREW
jgi:hypothetical protein